MRAAQGWSVANARVGYHDGVEIDVPHQKAEERDERSVNLQQRAKKLSRWRRPTRNKRGGAGTHRAEIVEIRAQTDVECGAETKHDHTKDKREDQQIAARFGERGEQRRDERQISDVSAGTQNT